MPKFVPRQRKHKVIARAKGNGRQPEFEVVDSNVVEHIPAAKSELEEKKLRLKEELKKEGQKISGKKAKRLEKYIDTKLRKDENRELIAKLAHATTDTSLFQSSRKLGQGRETKRERLGRALRDKQAGIDIDGDNDELLFEKRIVREVEDEPSSDENEPEQASAGGLFQTSLTAQLPAKQSYAVGGGLKRPLEVGDDGRPVLKKRKRRGGVQSKVQLMPDPAPEPEWEGFESASEASSNTDESSQSSAEEDDSSVEEEDEMLSEQDESKVDEDVSNSSESSGDEEEEDDSEDSSEESDDGEGTPQRQERSSAFKSWANQQLNEALGYESVSNVPNATETPKIAGFEPRALEEDPLPVELQPTTNLGRKAFSVSVERSPDIQTVRLQLPVVAEEQKIMEAVHNSNLVVVYGATGSGKTTQVPQFLFEAGYGSLGSPTPGMIGVTQPRRVAAVSMAKRVGDEMGNQGKKVAYQIRFEGTVSQDTAIKFMTDGVLLREVAQDIALRKYSAIIIDEAHERSVNTDILIGMLSRVVKLRQEMAQEDQSTKPLKLIIMSATLRITDFTENTTLFSEPPPVLQAEGRQYPVTTHFSRRTNHDYVEEAFQKISKGHKKLPPGGILVFLTGQNEITQLSKKLKEAFRMGHTSTGPQVRISGKDAPIETEDIDFGDFGDDRNDDFDEDDEADIDVGEDEEFKLEGEEEETGPAKMHILPLYSLLPTKEQLRVFEPPPEGSRLVVLATNVAETSLTIPGIRYVFDCGRSKERKYDKNTGVQSFEISWISKASASQRAGRAGRTGPGHCYRLYSSAVYERDFEEFAEPEILRMPIEGVVLQLKSMNLQHVINFPFPTPPDRQSLASSEKLLTYLSAISPTGQITSTGATMSIFPLSPRFARILLVGHLHDCLPYTIALVAGLSAADIFIPSNQAIPQIAALEPDTYLTALDHAESERAAAIRRHFNAVQKSFCFLDSKSDAIKLLQVVGEFAHEPTETWCISHFICYAPISPLSQPWHIKINSHHRHRNR
ncbi:putative ATP-dependent RNA helicase PB1A10.06c [Glarea lozoyensis 74030]|uniref:RNA helicase n=1 Tax=Glarea lozoyensis (strain ATCC 74030 / MF5533) TaxID=1104152 RepID=H0ECG6_GLAL7|nr:putative ATP-dependent RNA helicase PB1A10.06c [Glarea lozoyensis 74030]